MDSSSSIDSLVQQLIDAISSGNTVTAITVGLGVIAAVVVLILKRKKAAPKAPPDADLKG